MSGQPSGKGSGATPIRARVRYPHREPTAGAGKALVRVTSAPAAACTNARATGSAARGSIGSLGVDGAGEDHAGASLAVAGWPRVFPGL